MGKRGARVSSSRAGTRAQRLIKWRRGLSETQRQLPHRQQQASQQCRVESGKAWLRTAGADDCRGQLGPCWKGGSQCSPLVVCPPAPPGLAMLAVCTAVLQHPARQLARRLAQPARAPSWAAIAGARDGCLPLGPTLAGQQKPLAGPIPLRHGAQFFQQRLGEL
jgi:hypothetical protein